MNIGVLGWGSLLWDQGTLRLSSRWRVDGPRLPLEFARNSSGERLTLVIHPDSPVQQTYWAISEWKTMQEARANLREREGCLTADIHGLSKRGNAYGDISPEVLLIVSAWLAVHEEIDGIMWTGLSPRWTGGGPFSIDAAIAYLRRFGLGDRAHEYVTKAPPQIQTPIRVRTHRELGWADVPLGSDILVTDLDESN